MPRRAFRRAASTLDSIPAIHPLPATWFHAAGVFFALSSRGGFALAAFFQKCLQLGDYLQIFRPACGAFELDELL
jgi:hypothetical protein